MGERRQVQLLREFDRWGYDYKDWTLATRRTYGGRVRFADEWLGGHGSSVFWATLKDLQAFQSTIVGARNRNNTRQALVGFGDFLIFKGVRDDNPAKELERLREPRNIPKPLTMDEANRVLRVARALGQETYMMLLVLFYSGLRRGNVARLAWPEVSPDWKWIQVQAKGRKEHRVSVHPFLQTKLQAWKAVSEDPQWVFPSSRFPGRHISEGTLYARVREVGNIAGIENFHPHICRHTMATRAYELTDDIYVVQKMLGHASLASTEIYTEVRDPHVEEATGQLDFIS